MTELSETNQNKNKGDHISQKNISFMEIDRNIKRNYDLHSYTNSKLLVNIALDGSENIAVWKDTLDFAKENSVKFTFFIVGVHLLQDSLANLYDPPMHQRGRSDVGFGGDKARVESRLNMLRRAFREGHEIAGHGNGHWDGSEFTYEDWISELRQFDYFFRNAYEINGIVDPDPQEWNVIADSIVGFRAPLLINNKEMYKALKDMGYLYDTSLVLALTPKFQYRYNDIIIFPLNSLNTDLGKTISMDYNFLMLDKVERLVLARGCLKNIGGIFLKLEQKEMLQFKLVIISLAGMKEHIGGHLKRLFESTVNLNLRAVLPFPNALGSKQLTFLIDISSYKSNMT